MLACLTEVAFAPNMKKVIFPFIVFLNSYNRPEYQCPAESGIRPRMYSMGGYHCYPKKDRRNARACFE